MGESDFPGCEWLEDDFSDITTRDRRYAAKAYRLLVLAFDGDFTGEGESGPGNRQDRHLSSYDIMLSFRNLARELYGPLAFTVLTEWGLHSCADIGEMMRNLVESKRIVREEDDNYEDFSYGFDFEDEFLGPYLPREN